MGVVDIPVGKIFPVSNLGVELLFELQNRFLNALGRAIDEDVSGS